ncbi:type II toxin-antitoxin system Phd/YefM family antitoxin [Haloferula sargassicola]|uniref:Antitoxin n=1 Tax=Haloferula sargassicola TaxID=490096 RepID=A0ABP9UHP4_9BACT
MNIHEAKTHLSKLVEQAAAGEEIVIAKAGKPMAKLVPYAPPIAPRTGGFLAGQIWEAPDCWDADPELIQLMTEGEVEPSNLSRKVAENPTAYRAGK